MDKALLEPLESLATSPRRRPSSSTISARVKSHPQLFSVTVPVGNGEEIAVKLDDPRAR